MVKLIDTLSRLNPKKILLAGDLMVDAYTFGKVRRISPEAPVAVVHVQHEELRPGGAGNVALNMVSMGAKVSILGMVGNDPAGDYLRTVFTEEGMDIRGIVSRQNYRTPQKNRIIADNQQVVRIDHEVTDVIPEWLEEQILGAFPGLMEGIDLVAISDYGKGFLSRTLLAHLIDNARLLGIPVIADPKGVDFAKYRGATILKPNLSEAYAAANLPPEAPLEEVATKILPISQADVLMITRSESGISLFHKDGGRDDFPVRIREIKDVTGAGDTVLATLACSLANKLPLSAAVPLSNIAAGIAIERLGCARVTITELARRLIEMHVTNKIFDEEHLFALQCALTSQKLIVLGVSGEQGMTSHLFNAIRDLKKLHTCELLVYVRDENPSADFVNILAALHDVDFILLSAACLRLLTQQILPEEMYVLEGADLISAESAQCFVDG